MGKITIEIPEELEHKAKLLKVELSILLAAAIRKTIKDVEEIERFEKSIAKSKLTEKDVEEISDKINTVAWEHHKKKYNL